MTNVKKSDKPSHLPDRSDLSKLYFEPKTYDQKQHELTKLATFRRQNSIKHLPLKTASVATLAFSLTLILLANFSIIMTGSIPIIFFFFGGLILVFFSAISAIKYISNTFYTYDKSPTMFWVLYISVLSTLAACLGLGLLNNIPSTVWVPLACFIHFVVLIVYLLFVDKTFRKDQRSG